MVIMSRIGKQEIKIPQGTEVSVNDGVITVKGKHGSLERQLSSHVKAVVDGLK